MSKKDIYRRIKSISRSNPDVLGAIVFGSFAKGKKYNDIDLMIVGKSHLLRGLDWARSVTQLKQQINIPFLDLQLIGFEQFRDNLRNHTPFYLDIAADGKVVFDRANISEELKKTRSFIRQKSIKRDERNLGWDFPVKYRAETFLSPVSNKDRALIWLKDAFRDQEMARLALKKIPEKSISHSQQTAEKAVKAVLICFGAFKGVHQVGSILGGKIKEAGELPKIWQKKLSKLSRHSLDLEPELSKTRYPEAYYDPKKKIWIPMEEYKSEDALRYYKKAQEALAIAQEFIKWWFQE